MSNTKWKSSSIDAGRNRNPHARVGVSLANHLRSECRRLEGDTVVDVDAEHLAHHARERVDVVGDRLREEIDVPGGSTLVERGEEQAALEYEPTAMGGGGQAVEEPLQDVENKKLVGRSALSARYGPDVQVSTTASAVSTRPAHPCSTLSAERMGAETRSWRDMSARRASLRRGWVE